jgi:hypothetical protein
MPMGDNKFSADMQLENETKLEDPQSELDTHNKFLGFLLVAHKKDLPGAILVICRSLLDDMHKLKIARLQQRGTSLTNSRFSFPFLQEGRISMERTR